MTRFSNTDEPASSDQPIADAAAALDRGDLVVLPTETVYGVAASVHSERAMAALRELKGSDARRPFTVHLPRVADAERYVPFGGGVGRVLGKLLAGPVTVRVAVSEDELAPRLEAMGLAPSMRDGVYDGQWLALRRVDHAVAQQVLAAASGPVVMAGAPGPNGRAATDAAQARAAVGDAVAQVVDGGRCRFGRGSTIVRLTPGGVWPRVEVERAGVYEARTIDRMVRWTLLLVCSGNTCRSPMAAAIARELLAARQGVGPDELEAAGLAVTSAGLYAAPGQPASEPAVEAMAKQGLDLSAHRSQPLTTELIDQADMIVTMTESHRLGVISMAPWAEGKTFRLDPAGDIADPIGAELDTYQRTAAQMRQRLEERLKEQLL
jgi:protein-tyrosine phosphatase